MYLGVLKSNKQTFLSTIVNIIEEGPLQFNSFRHKKNLNRNITHKHVLIKKGNK